jgi:hypothetical protein
MSWTTEGSEFDSRYGEEFSLLHIIQTSSGIHLVQTGSGVHLLSNGYWGLFHGGKAAGA